MMTIRNHKMLIGIIGAVAIIATIFISTNLGKAMTPDEAKEIAKGHVPKTAEFVNTKDEETKYEVDFYDKTNKESFEVEVHKESKAVKKIESNMDNDRGSKTVKLSKSQASAIIKKAFDNLTSLKITLNKDDGLYKYDASFKAKDFYGSAEVNPETGVILESTIKYGTTVAIPNDPNGNGDLLTKGQAEAAALKFTDGGKIKDIDLDKNNGSYIYEVEVVKGNVEYELLIDAKTGKVTKEDETHISGASSKPDNDANEDNDQNNDNNQNSGNSSKISVSQAKSIVTNKIGGGSVTYIALDKEDGIYVYEGKAVKGNYEYEFEINATSGVITDWDKEAIHNDNDDHDDDNDDDGDDD
ncbi:MAG: PepSY domain-containing protein [Bacilli bacterium]